MPPERTLPQAAIEGVESVSPALAVYALMRVSLNQPPVEGGVVLTIRTIGFGSSRIINGITASRAQRLETIPSATRHEVKTLGCP